MPEATRDLDAICAREPIRIPGAIQPHGALLVFHPVDGRLTQASANASSCLEADVRIGMRLCDLPGGVELSSHLASWDFVAEPVFVRTYEISARRYDVSVHRTPQGAIVEYEPADPPRDGSHAVQYPGTRAFLMQLGHGQSLAELCATVARHTRQLTGFSRVLVYRFDPEWNGKVIAEDGDGTLPSYLDLHFPASDIPAQARQLYLLNRIRLIRTAAYEPSPIVPYTSPVDGRPLDLSLSALRSVSSVHLEYMRNMGTASSMSVSLIVDGRLWGLISCHSAQPHHVGAQARAACELIGQMMALQIGALERAEVASRTVELKQIEVTLLSRLSESLSVVQGLRDNPDLWLKLASAQGAAAVLDEGIVTAGVVPDEAFIQKLAAWIYEQTDEVVATERLGELAPELGAPEDVASGILAVRISQLRANCLIWFRPERVQLVSWGGEPRKVADVQEPERLHPRQSFGTWKQLVKGRSLPWSDIDVLGANDLRNAILNVVLRQAEERSKLIEELQRSNKELEAFSYSVSHDLRAPFRHIVGFSELLRDRNGDMDERSQHYLANIIDAAMSAGRLVDDLLSFSQLGRHSLALANVDVVKLVEEARRTLETEQAARKVHWDVGPLPVVWGDHAMLRQAILNLCSNALKYTRTCEEAVIRIKGEKLQGETVISIGDNGVGFDMAYVGKLFGVFQRLHRAEEFEGTGIGLALTKRIIDRHGGWIKAEGELGKGATFTFGLPMRDRETTT
jgi:light-regulated signal transduction histidine kinase (bacteriophytochrome)